MYKAVDIRDGKEIVILDPQWLRAINQLREFDRQDFLVCQGCNQPVRVRAGEERREHFAHKHLLNCTYTDESSTLRNARAVLYEWLVSKFGDSVTIEKRIADTEFFRPIDCWVEKDSRVFAYWIFDTTLKPEKRRLIQEGFGKLDVHANWVFALEMLRKEQNYLDSIILTTTEREFMQRSEYDAIGEKGFSIGKTLHYLNADNHQLMTFRGLYLIHEPQVYKGHNLTSDLGKVLVSPNNGEFVHEGEHSRLRQYQQKQAALEKRRKQAEEQQRHRLQTYQEPEGKRPEPSYTPPSISILAQETLAQETLAELINAKSAPPPAEEVKSSSYNAPQKEGVCIFCGEITTDWWWYDGKTGQCKCKSCMRQGKS